MDCTRFTDVTTFEVGRCVGKVWRMETSDEDGFVQRVEHQLELGIANTSPPVVLQQADINDAIASLQQAIDFMLKQKPVEAERSIAPFAEPLPA